MTLTTLVLRHSGFACLAVLANLSMQRVLLSLDASLLGYSGALIVGTGTGLVVKYILDKRWIFGDRATGLAAHGRRFSLYSLMGVATTAIFRVSETAFWLIGYAVKYRLDRRFVFSQSAPAA
ncbi:GtrA family protein [Pseudooceanicola sp.]|uniref:GtrA family protein n=1 Tax=Pseudooceanicola sp. TaxID=1914328 RepID=UPI002605A236|nr:GtrA family protein [Pseudooceanicola sp.]MDF1855983.1 GtrA family protein [Pseudooceanicola sp.]